MAPVAFITGASSGLGWEMARQLADRGYDLALLARRRERLEALAAELRPKGTRVLLIEADVTQWDAMQAAARQIEDQLGPIDLLLANAGVSLDAPLKRFDPIQARMVFETNVIGLMHSVAAVLPGMMQRKTGLIAGVSSLASYVALPRSTIYCASKAAASSYLAGLRLELAPYRIQVSTIAPGFIKTPMTDKNRFPMPFMMMPEPAVRLILNRLLRGDTVINFPWPTYLLVRLVGCLPDSLLRWLLLRARPS